MPPSAPAWLEPLLLKSSTYGPQALPLRAQAYRELDCCPLTGIIDQPLVRSSLAVWGRAVSETASFSLQAPPGAESGRDHSSLELAKDADHLPHGGPHRIVRIVSEHLSRAHGENSSTELPDLGQDGLLSAQVSRE